MKRLSQRLSSIAVVVDTDIVFDYLLVCSLSVYQFISLSTQLVHANRQRLFGYSVHLLLPQSRAITGCDTVSYFFKGELKKFSNT